jgi:hypothetical protein
MVERSRLQGVKYIKEYAMSCMSPNVLSFFPTLSFTHPHPPPLTISVQIKRTKRDSATRIGALDRNKVDALVSNIYMY